MPVNALMWRANLCYTAGCYAYRTTTLIDHSPAAATAANPARPSLAQEAAQHPAAGGAYRGVTLPEGRGAYTQQPRQILLVAISQREVAQLKEIVAEVDPDAFIIIGNAVEVLGHGFKMPQAQR